MLNSDNVQDSVGIKQLSAYDPWWHTTSAWLCRNIVISSGYSGIMLFGEQSVAEENYVAWSGLLFGESHGIYTGGNQRRGNARAIVRNVVADTVGGQDGHILYRIVNGICNDGIGTNLLVASNSVANCGVALSLNNSPVTLCDNVLCWNRMGWSLFNRLVTLGPDSRIMVISNNLLVASELQEPALWFGVDSNLWHHDHPERLLTSDKNWFCNVFSSDAHYIDSISNHVCTLAEWRAGFGQDNQSTDAGCTLRLLLAAQPGACLVYNASHTTQWHDLGFQLFYDVQTNIVRGPFALDPFTSRVLFTATNTTLLPLIVAATSFDCGYTGMRYRDNCRASYGLPPYTWQVGAGLPPGVSADASGEISGIPGSTGRFTFAISVSDARGDGASGTGVIDVYPLSHAPPGGTIGHGRVGAGGFY